jgi:zinc transporter ZupT
VTATAVFFTALATAFATGLGALPFAFRRGDARRWLGSANAIASGVMLGASASLLWKDSTEAAAGQPSAQLPAPCSSRSPTAWWPTVESSTLGRCAEPTPGRR